ncbi:MAG TPA: lysozyme inhibitor LprI family protein [Candidatus Acidoferrum sp.]|nr:lysozyme inhibitor LprI family protein [Candidatus Acidoferrum sp.]
MRTFFFKQATIAFFLFAGIASASYAQCDNPKTDAARAACIKTELKGSDSTINRTYSELMKSLSPEDRLALRSEQRSWIKTRDQQCGITWSKGDREAWFEDLLKDYQKTVCVVRLTNERVSALANYQKTNKVAPAADASAAPADGQLIYDLQSTEPKTSGKWYFEVKVDGAAIQKLAEVTLFIGVAQSAPAAGAANENGQATGSFVMIRRNNTNPDSGTLGFALDLDNGKLYTSQDGAWEGGTPGSAGGADILKGRVYKAYLNSSSAMNAFLKTHALEPNYGDHGFVYHVPDGYKPLEGHQAVALQ